MILSLRTLQEVPGVDTLSTKIYAEVRKGIKPEMYSLSTILFVTVLLLLLLVNVNPSPKEEKEEAKEREAMAKKGIRFRITKRVVFRRRYLLRKPECFSRRLPAADCVQLGRIYGF